MLVLIGTANVISIARAESCEEIESSMVLDKPISAHERCYLASILLLGGLRLSGLRRVWDGFTSQRK